MKVNVCGVVMGLCSCVVVLGKRGAQFGWRLNVYMVETDLGETCFQSGCENPKLELGLGGSGGDVERSVRWSIEPRKLSVRPNSPTWSIYLSDSESKNLTLEGHIGGVDPTYKFPRECDKTDSISLGSPSTSSSRVGSEESNRGIRLEGQCFNISLFVSWECCGPVCPSAGKTGSAGGSTPDSAEEGESHSCCGGAASARPYFLSEANVRDGVVPFWIALILGTASVCLLVVSIILLTLYLRQKRGGGGALCWDGKASLSSSSTKPIATHQSMCRSLSEESKYDVPWDQKFRPLPDYVRGLANGSPLSYPNSPESHD